MEQSIFKSVKRFVNISQDDDSFDEDLLIHINAAFALLHELGVGPSDGFVVNDDTSTWGSFITNIPQQNRVKNFVCLKARLDFDPPSMSFLLKAKEEQITELAHRISMHREGELWESRNPTPVEN